MIVARVEDGRVYDGNGANYGSVASLFEFRVDARCARPCSVSGCDGAVDVTRGHLGICGGCGADWNPRATGPVPGSLASVMLEVEAALDRARMVGVDPAALREAVGRKLLDSADRADMTYTVKIDVDVPEFEAQLDAAIERSLANLTARLDAHVARVNLSRVGGPTETAKQVCALAEVTYRDFAETHPEPQTPDAIIGRPAGLPAAIALCNAVRDYPIGVAGPAGSVTRVAYGHNITRPCVDPARAMWVPRAPDDGPAWDAPAPPEQPRPPAGMACARCRQFNQYAEPNQDDGTYVCFQCRQDRYR